jgi:hypothetical protein
MFIRYLVSLTEVLKDFNNNNLAHINITINNTIDTRLERFNNKKKLQWLVCIL